MYRMSFIGLSYAKDLTTKKKNTYCTHSLRTSSAYIVVIKPEACYCMIAAGHQTNTPSSPATAARLSYRTSTSNAFVGRSYTT